MFESITRYDLECADKLKMPDGSEMHEDDMCTVDIELDKDVDGPVYVYYQLENF